VKGLECVPLLKALGEESRLRILRAVSDGTLEVGEIAQRLGISPYNASKHLRVLRDAGLLQVERDGKRRLYSLSSDIEGPLKSDRRVLDLGCCTFRIDQLPE
jgi:DNA-binding transcriptional ArsR family regulator